MIAAALAPYATTDHPRSDGHGVGVPVITAAMSMVIGVSREEAWRAITDPAQVIRWDESMLALLEGAPDYPQVGQHVRWRYRFRKVPIVLHDRPLAVVLHERLRCAIDLGLFRFEQTYSLRGGAGRTQVGLRLQTMNSISTLYDQVDRFAVRRIASDFIYGRLQALQTWCDSHNGDPRSTRPGLGPQP